MSKLTTLIAAAIFLIASFHVAPGSSVAARRAAAMHQAVSTEEPTITTTTTELPPTPAPVIADPAVEEPTTTTTAPPARATGPEPGHYDCPEGTAAQDRQYQDQGCTRTPEADPGPNPGSDIPEQMASVDEDYQARLNAERCADNPMWCDVDSSGHYIQSGETR